MATRSGGSSTAAIGQLQEARESLSKLLGCRVDCAVTGHGLVLYAYPAPAGPAKKGRFGRPAKDAAAPACPTEHRGFPVVNKAADEADKQ